MFYSPTKVQYIHNQQAQKDTNVMAEHHQKELDKVRKEAEKVKKTQKIKE